MPTDTKVIREAYLSTLAHRNDTRFYEEAGLSYMVSPGHDKRYFNRVIHSKLNTQSTRQAIQKLNSLYGENGSDYEWIIWPDSAPSDLESLLLEQGFLQKEVCQGLLFDTDHYHIIPPVPEFHIERVTRQKIEEFVETSVKGWDSRKIDSAFLRKRVENSFDSNEFYLVRLKERAIGCSELKRVQFSGYLFTSSVLPEFRGRGAYRMLVRERLKFLSECGVKLASSIALYNTSAPILTKLGFRVVGELKFYGKFR